LLLIFRHFRAFDIFPYNEKNLHESGYLRNSPSLKRILDPIVRCSFAVEDIKTQYLVDTARKLFDASVDEWGTGALRSLVRSNSQQKENLEGLLSAGVDPDVPDLRSFRSSHACASKGSREAAGAIFLCRPDMAAKNCNNDTPLMAALRANYPVCPVLENPMVQEQILLTSK
jgi:hypothetical protein